MLAFKSYFMDEILSLKDEIKAYKINDICKHTTSFQRCVSTGNVQELPTEKSEDLILMRKRIKHLESENKFLKDDIFNKRKFIDKLLENNNKLVDHQSYHALVQNIQGSQSGPANGSRSPNDSKCKPVDNNRSNNLPVKLRENKN